MNEKRKIIAITMGDPAGIGSEIIIKALNHIDIYKISIPIVIGDFEALYDATVFCNSTLKLNEITDANEALGEYGIIDFIDLKYLSKGSWEYKRNNKLCGEAAFNYIIYAIKLAMENKVAAVITAPISKESLHLAGHYYSGHTEIFAEYTSTNRYAMLLASKGLKVIHVSTHVSLMEACKLVKRDRVLEVIELAEQGAKLLGIQNPKIGVAGLNPHCSENGLFGSEEINEIKPAIDSAKKKGIDVEGPIPPDTVFIKCAGGQYDIVVAMYHDQGHIPLKLSGFRYDLDTGFESVRGINCTIGLPIVRVSVDHGTAFGKAGDGRANEESLLDAIEAGLLMANNKRYLQ